MGSYLSDELLARRAAAGRLQDFEALLHRYRHRVYRICYRMAGNAEDAEDWAQECFVRVYKQLGSYNPALPFAPWFLRVVSNTCLNLARSRSIQRNRLAFGLDDHEELPSQTAGPLDAALSGEETRHVHAALATLPPPLRQAVTLRVLEGLSLRELAETLDVPLQTAASRVRRALNQVRERLGRMESEVDR